MRRLLVLATVLLLVPAATAGSTANRPVAIVAAETANEVLAVSLGPDGGHVLKRVRVADPLMVAAPLHGPAVVLNPHGTVTLLGWHSLRPSKVFHGFSDPQVARIAPGDRFAYVADGGSGEISVIDLARRRIVHRVYVGLQAHHMAFSPDGQRLWIALGEVATTIVRLDTSNLPATARSRPPPPTLPWAQHRLRPGRAYGLGQLGASALRDGLQRPNRQGRESPAGCAGSAGDRLLGRAGARHQRLRIVPSGLPVAHVRQARACPGAIWVVQPR